MTTKDRILYSLLDKKCFICGKKFDRYLHDMTHDPVGEPDKAVSIFNFDGAPCCAKHHGITELYLRQIKHYNATGEQVEPKGGYKND